MKPAKAKTKRQKARSRFIFLMLAWPVVHFILSQFLNINMVYMAFNDYTLGANDPVFVGLDNFEGIFRLFKPEKIDNEWFAIRNTLSIYALIFFVCEPLSLMFSYLLYSKVKGYRWLRTLLYLPCITSAVVLVLIFKSFVTSGPVASIYSLLGIYDKIPNEGWLGPDTAWTIILIFSVWTGFSSGMIYYLSAMNRIPEDLIEASKLDGASELQIFFRIVLPLISSTICTMMTLTVASVFAWGMPSMLMMGNDYGMNQTGAVGLSVLRFTTAKNYGVAAAYGLMLTIVGAPITLGFRKLANKFEVDVES